MSKFIKIDFGMGFSSVCDTKEEVMESCGYFNEDDKITWEDFLRTTVIEGEFEIIEVKGDNLDFKFLE